MKYGGPSVIPALTQGQPVSKEKRSEFPAFMAGLGWRISSFHVHLQEENSEFCGLVWRRVEHWQAEDQERDFISEPFQTLT